MRHIIIHVRRKIFVIIAQSHMVLYVILKGIAGRQSIAAEIKNKQSFVI
jgi:hypothetical protein